MKALFARSSSSSPNGRRGTAGSSSSGAGGVANMGISPVGSYANSTLERRLAVHATKDGLIVVPKPAHGHHHTHLAVPSAKKAKSGPAANENRSFAPPAPAIRIVWGRDAKVCEIAASEVKALTSGNGETSEIQVYGIVGIMRVFNRECAMTTNSVSDTYTPSPSRCVPPRDHQPRARWPLLPRLASCLPMRRRSGDSAGGKAGTADRHRRACTSSSFFNVRNALRRRRRFIIR